MSGAYEIPPTRIEIRDIPGAEFGNFLKLLANLSTLFKLYETFGIAE
jgi:hypothetical protein